MTNYSPAPTLKTESQSDAVCQRNLKIGCVELRGTDRQIVHAEYSRDWLFNNHRWGPFTHQKLHKTGPLLEYLSPESLERLKHVEDAEWWLEFCGKFDFAEGCPHWFNEVSTEAGMAAKARSLEWCLRWPSPEFQWQEAEEELGLPDLTGSPDQIRWARGIRFKAVTLRIGDERFTTAVVAASIIKLRRLLGR